MRARQHDEGRLHPCRNDNEGLADVVRALDAAGVKVSDLRVHQPTLDDVFLAKTGRSSGRRRRARAGCRRRAAARSGGRLSMSAIAVASPRAFAPPSLATQVGVLARRSVLRTIRQPAQIIPSLIFPLFMLAVNASGLKSATNIPGFPTHSYITFALAIPFMQGALFGIINAGTDIANDIETGFLNRLQMTPVRGVALLAGELAGVVGFGVLTVLFYICVGLMFGAHVEAGVPGVLVLLALAAVIMLGFGALGALAALRTGSGEAVQGLFPVFFVSCSCPRCTCRAT